MSNDRIIRSALFAVANEILKEDDIDRNLNISFDERKSFHFHFECTHEEGDGGEYLSTAENFDIEDVLLGEATWYAVCNKHYEKPTIEQIEQLAIQLENAAAIVRWMGERIRSGEPVTREEYNARVEETKLRAKRRGE